MLSSVIALLAHSSGKASFAIAFSLEYVLFHTRVTVDAKCRKARQCNNNFVSHTSINIAVPRCKGECALTLPCSIISTCISHFEKQFQGVDKCIKAVFWLLAWACYRV
ncbi:unnamed protein product [Ixodes persulcatus]